ncbi:hypothetical protein ASL20_09620 [Cupriavidus necator]|uniref:phage tail protein n=1 Tax=Cupriavidus necator TaxID=106590 RepID=UPI00073520BB|nr:phage tail protein [Cupriavidus necator]KUE88874.1 hypothetical protein ASL20_09620 [Cupriavidus necator]
MADIDFFNDFQKIWATNGDIEPISQSDYLEGWAYIGDTPPSVEQFNRAGQVRDERIAWLFQQMQELARVFDYPIAGDRIDALTQAFAAIRSYHTGDVVVTAGTVPPPGTLAMNGALVSRTVYSDLFEKIGTRYGPGDGSTTFGLPFVPEGYTIVAGIAEPLSWATAGAVKMHTHEASTGGGGAHGHAGWTDQQGDHDHAYLYSPAATNPDQQGAADGASYLDLTKHAWNRTDIGGRHGHNVGISDAGDHVHPVSVQLTGAGANYPAGVKFLMCIAF